MIDVKQAVQLAKLKAAEMLEVPSNLEEIERDSYKGREVWSITLSMPSNVKPLGAVAALFPGLQYKRFLLEGRNRRARRNEVARSRLAMTSAGLGVESASSTGLLVDTNLLVLFAVGMVNRKRIETFKRTRQYTASDYNLLVRVLSQYETLYTVAHVLAEVSNLTDLAGAERLQARRVLKKTISVLNEAEMPSALAAEERMYPDLGLVDAAIGAVARTQNCAVLTDDLDLYLRLSRDNIKGVQLHASTRAGVGNLTTPQRQCPN